MCGQHVCIYVVCFCCFRLVCKHDGNNIRLAGKGENYDDLKEHLGGKRDFDICSGMGVAGTRWMGWGSRGVQWGIYKVQLIR